MRGVFPALGAVRALVVALVVVGAVACSGDGGGGPEPRADLIAPALDAVEAERGVEPELLEIAATLEHVDVIVRENEGTGVLYRYDDDGLDGPIEPRDDLREWFAPADVAIDPQRIFVNIRSELDDAAIIDLAIREEGGVVLIDATVASSAGGILLVLLGPDGAILGTQAV